MKGVPVEIWYFDSDRPARNRRGIYSPHKVFLYEVIYRSITKHDVGLCCWVMRILPRLTTLDPYVLFRVIMIMINSVNTRKINKNFVLYLETLLSKLNFSKPDVFLEFITYFFSHNRVEDAQELFAQRHRYMSYLYHKALPPITINLKCYDFLFNYLDWKKRVKEQSEIKFDVSIQGWFVNAMDPLKNVDSNYEFFIMCILDVLLHHGFHSKAYLFSSEFQKSNQDNISAQLLLSNLLSYLTVGTSTKRRRIDSTNYNLMLNSDQEISRLEARSKEVCAMNNFTVSECNFEFDPDKYPIASDKKNIFDNLCRLELRRPETYELSLLYSTKLATLQLMMDVLEFRSEITKSDRWWNLQEMLNDIISSTDEILLSDVKDLWQTRYQKFWFLGDFLAVAVDENGKKMKHRKVIKYVIQTFKARFDGEEEVEDDLGEQCDGTTNLYHDIE